MFVGDSMSIRIFSRLSSQVSLQQNSKSLLKPIEPISKIEPLKPFKRDEPTTIVIEEELPKLKNDLVSFIEQLETSVKEYSKTIDYEFKSNTNTFEMISAIRSQIPFFHGLLRQLESTPLLDLQKEIFAVRSVLENKRMQLSAYMSVIHERYELTTTDPNYHYEGNSNEYGKWRREALELLEESDLSCYTDLQLKYYVVAAKQNPNQKEEIRKAMNPMRSPEHIRLLFQCLEEDAYLEVLAHPEYSADKVKSLMPDLLACIQDFKKK